MKRTLRVLCMGVMAALSAVGFAQTNVTGKLLNPDMEKGVLGWDVDFEGTDIWKKTTKNQATQPSYYGMDNLCLEVWRSNNTSLTNTSISQTLKELPNGTYVFGAYMVACIQTAEELRETIEGVSIFANEEATPVATNTVQNMDTIWAHSAKFNVAASVIDGTLKVGVNVAETNASFVVVDNATLYYFGDMEPAEALNEMAKIDISATIAIADTCVGHKMNVATSAALDEAIKAAKELTTNEGLFTADENLYWAIRQAVKSIKDYVKLEKALADANEVANREGWSDEDDTQAALTALKALIAEIETMYDEGTAEHENIDILVTNLADAMAYVRLDDVYKNLDIYDEKINGLDVGESVGEYTEEMVDEMKILLEDILVILAALEDGTIGAEQAIQASNTIYAKIDNLIDNPNAAAEFPITIPRGTEVLNKTTILKGSYLDENGLAHFKSKTYTFDYPLQKVRFVIKESGANTVAANNNGYPHVAISEFSMYDASGDPIDLTEDLITSNADYNALNASTDGQGISGLIDGDYNTYFHSAYKNGPADYHYIEVTLPGDDYYAFSFKMSARSNSDFHTGQFPAVIEIQHLSEADADLRAAITAGKEFVPYYGVDPGFYNINVDLYKEALAAAEALIDTEASDSEIYASIDKIAEERQKIEDLGVVKPDPEKEYRIVSATQFFEIQGVHKAITVLNSGSYVNQLGWETACADSTVQLFKFEPLESEGEFFYAMKHVATGMYVNEYYDTDGNLVPNAFGLSVEPGVVELKPLGVGQFGIKNGTLYGNTNSNMMHTNGYNNGQGKSSTLVKWETAANSGSAWFIREMSTLPCAVKSISDLDFKSACIHLYEPVNTITLTADVEECAFSDFKLYDLYGAEIPATMTVNDASATLTLDATIVTFSFAFTNTEGVAEISVNGSISTLSLLQEAYKAALAVAPVKSDEVGKYNDLSEYEAALEAAENLLASGGSDEAIQQAVENLEKAVDNLGNHINLPATDKDYYLLAGYTEFKKNSGIDMAIFVKMDTLYWSYAKIADNTYRWRFVESDSLYNDKPAYYIRNVGTELYVGSADGTKIPLPMVEDASEALPYGLYSHTDGSVALTDGKGMFFHFDSHGNGAGACGNIIYWNGAGGASAIKIVDADKFVEELIKELGVEDVEIAGEVAPALKGTYDLFGRRIDTPVSTGIYIVDGVKRVIKK